MSGAAEVEPVTGNADAVDLARHPATVPFMRALGVEWRGGSADGVTLRLPWAPRASLVSPREVDARAAAAVLDYAGGIAVYAALQCVAVATLELRIDIVGAAPVGDVRIDARTIADFRGSASVTGEARGGSDDGTAFLRMSARYLAGSAPGQAPAGPGYLAEREERQAAFAEVATSTAGCFGELLGVVSEGSDWVLPFAPALVGSVMLPAFHGGAVAAALMTALEASGAEAVPHLRLSSITVQYLRPARAVDARLVTRTTQTGRRAAFIEASMRQGDTLVATAQALFG